MYEHEGFTGGSGIKNLPANARDAGDAGSILESDFPGGGIGNPLQFSCLENPMDRGVMGSQRVRRDLTTK